MEMTYAEVIKIFNEIIETLSKEKITVTYRPANLRRRLVSGTPYGRYEIESPSLGLVTIRVWYDEDMDLPHSDAISISGPKLSKNLDVWDLAGGEYDGKESFQKGLNFVKTLTWSGRARTLLRSRLNRGK